MSTGVHPHLLSHAMLRRGESALRDSYSPGLNRQGSIGQGAQIPHFEKKLYLDFNLFDDSSFQNNERRRQPSDGLDDVNAFEFKPLSSRARSTSKIIKFRQNRKITKEKLSKAMSFQSQRSCDSDGDLMSD